LRCNLRFREEPDVTAFTYERRWLILALIGTAQLMIVLDLTIVNIALPSAQRDLGFSNDERQWIITAYALAFGSLLLLGGKLGDLFGRKWASSAACSASPPPPRWAAPRVVRRARRRARRRVSSRAARAVRARAARHHVHRPAERGKAFGIFGAIAGGGSRSACCSEGSSPSGSAGAGACT
jgi:MFS family permease